MKKIKRITITPKEASEILGRGVSYCQKLFTLIRVAYSKDKRKPVTIKEFCEYEQISEAEVREALFSEQ